MSKRYTFRKKVINRLSMYREHFIARGLSMLEHFETPNMTYPTASDVRNMTIVKRVWKQGDRYYKLAYEHYGDPSLWWLIAWYNQAPTESHLTFGQIVRVPLPLSAALSFMRDKKT